MSHAVALADMNMSTVISTYSLKRTQNVYSSADESSTICENLQVLSCFKKNIYNSCTFSAFKELNPQ